MWAARYWATEYWGPRYWDKAGGALVLTEPRYTFTARSRLYQCAARQRLYRFTAVGVSMKAFAKEPGESYTVSLDFTDILPEGTELSSGVLSAIEERTGTVATLTVLASATPTIDEAAVLLAIQAGTAGRDYVLTATLTLDSGAVLVENLRMQVRSRL
jgi:hypothetical protein